MGDVKAVALRSYAIVLWWLILAGLTLTSTISSTITMGALALFGVLLLPALALPGAFAGIVRDRLVVMFCVALGLIALAYAVTAQHPSDMLLVGNFAPLLLAIPVYAVAQSLSGVETVRLVATLCLLGCVVALGVGVYTVFVLNLPRADGFLTGSLIYARLAVLLGFIAATGCLIPGSRWRYVYALGPVIATAVCVLAGARGVLLCVPFLLLLFFVFLLSERTARERWWIVGGLVSMCVLGAAVALLFVDVGRILAIPAEVINVITGNGGATDLSTQYRLSYYWAGWTAFQRAPLFGYGWAHLRDAAFLVLDPVAFADFFSFHNDFLNFAVSGGIVGVAALVIILAAPIAGVLTTPRDGLFALRVYGASSIVMLYALSGLTDMVIGYDMPTFGFAMMSAIVLGAFRERPTPATSPASS